MVLAARFHHLELMEAVLHWPATTDSRRVTNLCRGRLPRSAESTPGLVVSLSLSAIWVT